LKILLTILALFLGASAAPAGTSVGLERSDLDNHQDSARLTRMASGVIPADGLLAVTLGGRTYSTVYQLNGFLERVDQKDAFLQVEYTPLTWFSLWGEVPWRTWSGGNDWIPDSGSGLGDGQWEASLGLPGWPGLFHAALTGGGNIPVGDEANGLAEGVFSPRAGAAFTLLLWRDNQVPEMRLHFNIGHAWNKNEDQGYGMESAGFQPWPPRYQSAATAGGTTRNDAMYYGGALEFRQKSTSLWIEYGWERFRDNSTVSPGEHLRFLTAGLRWGVVEGWALRGDYLVSLANDDEVTEWYPAYPDWSMSVAVSRQFSLGGHDSDGDGIPDRKDHCPDGPEDLDGWQDADGCPDPDNDLDGVLDRYDGAPSQPEDHDGWQDEDGIPDPDNDGDGILDRDDLCPDEPEDFDGKNDRDGCPDDFADSDGDGVDDDADQCPDQPEDRDGFEDDDGCPEPDNDRDGILDEDDQCPDEPEDYDGDRDDDGCPDLTEG